MTVSLVTWGSPEASVYCTPFLSQAQVTHWACGVNRTQVISYLLELSHLAADTQQGRSPSRQVVKRSSPRTHGPGEGGCGDMCGLSQAMGWSWAEHGGCLVTLARSF